MKQVSEADSGKSSAWKVTVLSREEQYDLKRKGLIQEAARAFSTRGYHATSLADVARELGVTKGALYYYVKSKQDMALLQRLAAVRGRLSLCADQAAAAKWWLSMPMASVSAEGPMPKALSTRRTSPLMPGCRHQGRACPLRRARMTSNPLIVA